MPRLFDVYQQAVKPSSLPATQTGTNTGQSTPIRDRVQSSVNTQLVPITQNSAATGPSTPSLGLAQGQNQDDTPEVATRISVTANPSVSVDPPLLDDESPSTGLDCSLVDLTSQRRSGGEQPAVLLTSAYKRPRADNMDYEGKALRVFRHIAIDGEDLYTELKISSPHIQQALRTVASSYGMVTNYGFLNLCAQPIVIRKPYAPLFHCQGRLIEYAQQPERTPEERAHLELLTGHFYEKYMGDSVRKYEAGIENGMVAFSNLWMLFQVGDDILVTTPHYKEICRVVDCAEEQDRDNKAVFMIYVWRWGYNAGKFGPCSESLSISKYSGDRAIDQLRYYPLKFLTETDRDVIQKEAVFRGHKWRNLVGPSYKEYKGRMWTGKVKTSSDLEVGWNEGRIMVDQQLYSEYACSLDDQLVGAQGYRLNTRDHGRSAQTLCLPPTRVRISNGAIVSTGGNFNRNVRKITLDQAECHDDEPTYEMTDEQALLAPARAKGFSMSEQKFAWFLVDGISEVSFREDGFAKLAMPEDSKIMIRTLAQSHSTNKCDFEDMVRGKSQGMIISLEGPPGSGKTLTAETVAELTHRPFYSIGTAALGTDAKTAEVALRAIFNRGERWNALVLLDEADLFLAKRTSQELDRNALVNVFLRNLEYFGGLLFLTSNRVEEFDAAFDSRIHLHISFGQPDESVRTQIWRNFLPNDWPGSDAEELAKDLKINGREIKNLMRTVALLSQSGEHTLSLDLIRSIHDMNLKGRAVPA